ncbi:MAG: hypothetical protein EPO65_05470 [Dehalococcoidia bacterium]|nr:MAG: hypothetical protein EPO65_05470 [Dehalococcoidia bacterium]
MPTRSSSSSRDAERLLTVPLERLHPHPANPNVMAEAVLATLARNIERSGRYPPIVVRAHPELAGDYQIIDGAQRSGALRLLGHAEATCFLWPCDDATALLLLATLNRLHGEDLPYRRAELLAELEALVPRDLLSSLLPEDASTLDATLALLDVDRERLLDDLTAAAAERSARGPRLISFAVAVDDEPVIEAAVVAASEGLSGPNRRGRALALVCAGYLERHHG